MKTMVHMTGFRLLMLLLVPLATLSAGNRNSEEEQKRESIKNSGWIGIMIQDVDEKIADKKKLDSDDGVYVKEVVKNSPADSAGIQEGDILMELKGNKIFDSEELVKIVRRTAPGTKIDLVLVRDGQKKTLQVTVGRNKISKHQKFGMMPPMPDVHVFVGDHILGMRLLTLNEQLGGYFGAPNNEGVLVEEVEHESTAEKAGFKAGDILIRVGKKSIDDAEKVQREFGKYDEGDKVECEVIRKGMKKTLSVEMGEEQDHHRNFFFRNRQFNMFRTDPSVEGDDRFEMDELRSSLEKAQIELRNAFKGVKGIPHKISTLKAQFAIPPMI